MKKELLFSVTKEDFDFQFFRCGGHGGQKQNKTSSGVRIIHKESGARGESREERYQHSNKIKAFKRLIETNEFKGWLKRKISEVIYGIDKVKQKTEESMKPENLKIEIGENGKWTTVNNS